MNRLALFLTLLSAVACDHGNPPEIPSGLPPTDPIPILKYEIISHPPAVVGSSGRTLKVTASNHNKGSVTVKYISIGISVGPAKADLVPAQYAKDIDFAFSPDWNPYNSHPDPADGYVTFILQPSSGSTHTFKNGDTATFEFDNVSINTVAGPANIEIKEGTSGDPSIIKSLTKWPQGSGMANIVFSANQNVVSPDDPKLRLSWSGGPSDATYELEYYTPEDGDKKISLPGAKGEYPAKEDPGIKLEHDTFFYLTATYQGSSETQFLAVTVTVPPPTITQFTGKFTSKDGIDQLLLSWQVENVNPIACCKITGDTGPQSAAVKDYQIIPTTTKPLLSTYTLTAESEEKGVPTATKTLALTWGADAPGSPVEVGTGLTTVAFSPDGRLVFVPVQYGNSVSVLNVKTLGPAPGSPVMVGNQPMGIAVSPEGARVFVPSAGRDEVSVLDAQSLRPVPGSPIKVGSEPMGIAVSPDGARVFVANCDDDTVSVFDAQSLLPVSGSPVAVGSGPMTIAVSPDSTRVFVASEDAASVTVLDTRSLQPVPGSPISTGVYPAGIAISPDGARVFVAKYDDNTVSVLDTQSLQPVPGSPVSVGSEPMGIAISPDGTKVFVANNGDDTVSVLDARSLQPVPGSSIKVGDGPDGVAVSPDGARIFVANRGNNTLSVIIPSGLEPVTE